MVATVKFFGFCQIADGVNFSQLCFCWSCKFEFVASLSPSKKEGRNLLWMTECSLRLKNATLPFFPESWKRHVSDVLQVFSTELNLNCNPLTPQTFSRAESLCSSRLECCRVKTMLAIGTETFSTCDPMPLLPRLDDRLIDFQNVLSCGQQLGTDLALFSTDLCCCLCSTPAFSLIPKTKNWERKSIWSRTNYLHLDLCSSTYMQLIYSSFSLSRRLHDATLDVNLAVEKQ